VAFQLVHAAKYRNVHKLKIHKLYTTQKKQYKIHQNKTTLVQSLFFDTQPGKEMGFIYHAPKPTRLSISANEKTKWEVKIQEVPFQL